MKTGAWWAMLNSGVGKLGTGSVICYGEETQLLSEAHAAQRATLLPAQPPGAAQRQRGGRRGICLPALPAPRNHTLKFNKYDHFGSLLISS